MFKLSKKADYGLIAVKHLAMHRQEHACSANEIAEEYGISVTLMAKVLQRLAREEVVVAKHGSTGGYQLAKDPRQVSALDVISAIDGPVLITSCVTSHGNCETTERCSVREPLRKVNESILGVLSTVTIAQMSEDPNEPALSGIVGPDAFGFVDEFELGDQEMAVKLPIYMDNHATTPVDPRVVEAMLPYFTEKFGNAASRNHSFGWAGEEAVETARQQIASLINATPKEIIFTSGATESDNLMIKGIAEMFREKGNHIITQAIEHKAVLDTCKRLEKDGFEVTYLPVQKDGRVNLDELKAAIRPTTILITIMYANNEIGVINPIAEIGKIAKEHGIFFAVRRRAGRGQNSSRRAERQHRLAGH